MARFVGRRELEDSVANAFYICTEARGEQMDFRKRGVE